MIARSAVAGCFAVFLSSLLNAAHIYRWVDEKGQTHFADVVPEKFRLTAA